MCVAVATSRCFSCLELLADDETGLVCSNQANDNSGYIGAAIVGSFVFVVSSWYGVRYLYRKWQKRQARTQSAEVQ